MTIFLKDLIFCFGNKFGIYLFKAVYLTEITKSYFEMQTQLICTRNRTIAKSTECCTLSIINVPDVIEHLASVQLNELKITHDMLANKKLVNCLKGI